MNPTDIARSRSPCIALAVSAITGVAAKLASRRNSWITPNPYNPVVQLLRRVTEPVLAPFRRLLPPWKTFGLDFSPMIVILLIQWAIKPLLWTLVG